MCGGVVVVSSLDLKSLLFAKSVLKQACFRRTYLTKYQQIRFHCPQRGNRSPSIGSSSTRSDVLNGSFPKLKVRMMPHDLLRVARTSSPRTALKFSTIC